MKKLFAAIGVLSAILAVFAVPVLLAANSVGGNTRAVMAAQIETPTQYPTETAQPTQTNTPTRYPTVSIASLPPTVTPVILIVNVENLNMRAEGNDKSKIIHYLKYGDKLTVISVGGNWAQVEHNGIVGYVNTKFCRGQ